MLITKVVLLFEILAVIFGIIYYKKYFNTPLKYFLMLLILFTVVEIYYNIWPSQNNTVVHNILNVIEFLCYFFIYYSFTKKIKHRKIILSIATTYLIFVLVNFWFFQKLSSTGSFSSYSYIFGAISLVIAIGLYLIEILKSDEVLFIKKSLLFWISSGLLIYYVGVIPPWVGLTYLPIEELYNLPYLMFSLAIIMYSCFIFGFIWSKPLSSSHQ